MNFNPARRTWVLGFVAALSLWIALPAAAIQITLDLDSGIYDPTIVPGPETHCPCDYLEDGVRFAGFWAKDVGTATGEFVLGHTHLATHNYPGTSGLGERQHAWIDDIQGNLITMLDGSNFSVVSIDYRIRKRTSNDPLEETQPWSFGSGDIHMLLATSFDPTLADFEGQWTAFDIDSGSVPVEAPWETMAITGFDDISSLYLTNSAFVSFDNIVLEVTTPEPTTAVLLGLGLACLACRRKSR